MQTPFRETEALLAALDGDRAEVRAQLAEFYPSELITLAKACYVIIADVRRDLLARRHDWPGGNALEGEQE